MLYCSCSRSHYLCSTLSFLMVLWKNFLCDFKWIYRRIFYIFMFTPNLLYYRNRRCLWRCRFLYFNERGISDAEIPLSMSYMLWVSFAKKGTAINLQRLCYHDYYTTSDLLLCQDIRYIFPLFMPQHNCRLLTYNFIHHIRFLMHSLFWIWYNSMSSSTENLLSCELPIV